MRRIVAQCDTGSPHQKDYLDRVDTAGTLRATSLLLVQRTRGQNIMLIRFSVENFMSFKDEVEFSMVPGRTRMHRDHVYVDDRRKDIRLLKSSVIYGANASGKTNLIKAMDFAQDLIIEGANRNQDIQITPFLLDSKYISKPSRFAFEIKVGAKSYLYRFVVDRKRVHSETLIEMRRASERLIFERITDAEGQTQVTPGHIPLKTKDDRRNLNFIARGTRRNQLFLTETVDRNLPYFADVYDWFRNRFVLIYPDSSPGGDFSARFLNTDDDFQQKFRDLIELFDLGIEDIDLEPLEVDAKQLFSEEKRQEISRRVSELPEDSDAEALLYNPQFKIVVNVDKFGKYDAFHFVTIHRIKDEDRNVQFSLFMESDGTNRLFELTPALIRLLNSEDEIVFVIDELDRCLHSHMSRNILDIFLTNAVGRPSQMIVTTHESGILDLDLLRRDEIWFIEKDSQDASTVYSLEEFAPRFDTDIERGYLTGRYGAIPILPSYNILDWAR